MANNYLITGYWGEPHVTAENDRGFNAAVFGAGRFVLPVGQQFRAEYIGNNTVRLYDGKLIDNGAVAGIPAGKYVDLLIPEAGQGMNRNDLIVFSYAKDASTLVETGAFIVLTGTETSGAAIDPAFGQQDLLTDEATADIMPLYRVAISGASIAAPAQMFEVSRNFLSSSSASVALNLLDNSDFRNPVNSKGATSYSGLGFSIDRWVVPNDTSALTVGNGFVLFQNDNTASAAAFVNRLRAGTLKSGKTYTGVLCFNDGSIVFGSGVCGSGSGSVPLTDASRNIFMQIATSTDYDPVSLVVAAGSYDRLVYAALYEGEYTESTLPAYIPKGYGAEVANCHVAEHGIFGSQKLLWENASASSAFAAQTISLDLSGYDAVRVVFYNRSGASTDAESYTHSVIIDIGASELPFMIRYNADARFEIYARLTVATTTGVQFRAGRYISNEATKWHGTAAADVAVPFRIYGIKEGSA